MSRRVRLAVGDDDRLVYKLASLLLCYPTARLWELLTDIRAAADGISEREAADALRRTAEWLTDQRPAAAERHYVEVFDLTRRASPYLTYYRYGDTRQRGMALLALKHTYRAAGFTPAGTELPDYLPAVLEFAALTGEPGFRLLQTHRAGLELLRLALHDAASPYAAVLDAVSATLPALSSRQAADVRRLVADGPPAEDVGLDPVGTAPFAPPEMLGGR